MNHTEAGSFTFTPGTTELLPTITAVAPVNRDALQNYIANIRQAVFYGTQVPLRIVHIDPVAGTEQHELVPGCATCSL